MVMFVVEGTKIDLPRNLALIDTNILVSFADPDDQHHLYAQYFLDTQNAFALAVAPPVIAEACSYLIGARRKRPRAEWLLAWLLTPGNGVRILPAPHGSIEEAVSRYLQADSAWMERYKVDYVDAYLMHMAHQITSDCSMKPDIAIVTKDVDFTRCFGCGYNYRVYNPVTEETLAMGV